MNQIHWGKRPEFSTGSQWRHKLSHFLLAVAFGMTAYNGFYAINGVMKGTLDHEKEREKLFQLDDKINEFLFGKTMKEIISMKEEKENIVEMAAKIREQQQQQQNHN
jgi:hypothetical protein